MDAPGFPLYTDAERTADRMVHLFGMLAAPVAALWLLSRAAASAGAGTILILTVYSAGLLGMLGSSAAYNLARPGRLKGRLRRLDHAMIFAMIAGSYTPFALFALAPSIGVPLCATVWALALAGMVLKLVAPPSAGTTLPADLFGDRLAGPSGHPSADDRLAGRCAGAAAGRRGRLFAGCIGSYEKLAVPKRALARHGPDGGNPAFRRHRPNLSLRLTSLV